MEKIFNPKECIKHMKVEMHPTLLEKWFCADIEREVTAVGAKLVPSPDIYDPALVMWSRNLPPTLVNEDGELALLSKETCKQALYIMTAKEVSDHVAAHSLAGHINMIKDLVDRTLTFVLYGCKEYFKPAGKRKTMNSSRKKMTEQELDTAKIDLLVGADCDTVIVNTPNELALLIVQLTKAIAEAPTKLAKRKTDEEAEYYMRGDKRNAVGIDKDGVGVAKVWQQIVGVLPGSSLELSRALCSQYKTPRQLYQACQSSNGVNQIADIGVARAAVPGSKTRRIGPEFARKLHILFTADNGDMLIE